jgi:D-alanyl-lipoteichoic acid acyltransferase DltB (MBOAT superfamily)
VRSFLVCSVQAEPAEVGYGLRKEKGAEQDNICHFIAFKIFIPTFVSLSTPISSVPSLKRALNLQIPKIFMKTQTDYKPNGVYGSSLKVATNDGNFFTSSTSIVEYER